MRPILKAIGSPDVPDLERYNPGDSFGFLLELSIGPENDIGEELFDVMVVTPQWLTERYDKDEIILGQHYLIVFEYNYERLIRRIKKYLMSCSGETWHEVAVKVGRLGHWEFEDYQPD